MPRPTKYAALICFILSIVLVVGIILGFTLKIPWLIVALLLPVVIYQAYRTEGESTRWASWAMLLVIIAELVLVALNIEFNLAKLLGMESAQVAGFYVHFGDLRVVFPAVMAILSFILIKRTRGIYTKWLAALIFVGALAIIYLSDPIWFGELLNTGAKEALDQI